MSHTSYHGDTVFIHDGDYEGVVELRRRARIETWDGETRILIPEDGEGCEAEVVLMEIPARDLKDFIGAWFQSELISAIEGVNGEALLRAIPKLIRQLTTGGPR